ncbi:histidinol dehydrogenase [Agrococcus sp. SCSIO52902]|uniref:histidinol dehydrogenase n=1 Tax=Agrococcus sp. SCSIO52902 TaxID=2933290 RepID=UPI001FF14240|nr:histidinol dehydrogenase [Agrococcus sp. SCSIO52902]UOW00229.1 histidinol dehydrogenase [Agrococcus sp. SCSIO52902]
MLRRLDLTTLPDEHELRALLPRPAVDVDRALPAAQELIADVRERGAEALAAQAERFDGVRPAELRVPAAALQEALAALDPAVRAALETAIERVRIGSAAQVPAPTAVEPAPGAAVELRWQPVDRVGLYVPGGKAVYPSSVVMNVVAAQAAGVRSIAVASPAQAEHDGLPHPTILAACALLGVDEVYAMGGAGAVGAFAHGVPGIGLAPVDVVTGPGNVFVAAAKRAVAGSVRVDSEAGPTEILVIADGTADAELIAADLVSQAEHDELASAVLVTDDAALADRVYEAVARRAAATAASARVGASLAGEQSAIVLVADLAAAARVSDAYAPEHLEIMTADDDAVLARIRHAGAIFLGAHTPVSLGDYAAGSNHVLPTGGQARRVAGLGAATFLRPQQVVRYDRAALAAVRADVVALAAAEGLPAHGEAIEARFEAGEA